MFKLVKQNKGYYSIEGSLSLHSIDKNVIKLFDFLKTADEICIDLAKLTSTDSAGLALIIEWIKQSKQYGTKLTLKNIPNQLKTLAKLCGFELYEYFSDSDLGT